MVVLLFAGTEGTFTHILLTASVGRFAVLGAEDPNAFVDIETEPINLTDRDKIFWESTPMPLEFRLHRFDAHLRQHTIQIEKTLKAIGLPFTEAKRLLRLIYAALADVENQAIGLEDFGGLEQAKVVTLINDYSNEVNEILSV